MLFLGGFRAGVGFGRDRSDVHMLVGAFWRSRSAVRRGLIALAFLLRMQSRGIIRSRFHVINDLRPVPRGRILSRPGFGSLGIKRLCQRENARANKPHQPELESGVSHTPAAGDRVKKAGYLNPDSAETGKMRVPPGKKRLVRPAWGSPQFLSPSQHWVERAGS
jgi:hypothetical protein